MALSFELEIVTFTVRIFIITTSPTVFVVDEIWFVVISWFVVDEIWLVVISWFVVDEIWLVVLSWFVVDEIWLVVISWFVVDEHMACCYIMVCCR